WGADRGEFVVVHPRRKPSRDRHGWHRCRGRRRGRRPCGGRKRRDAVRERGYGGVFIKQLSELDFDAEPLVQRSCRLREGKRIEPEFDERNRWIKAFGLQSGEIGEQLTKAGNMQF